MGRDGDANYPIAVICASMSQVGAISELARQLHSIGLLVFVPLPAFEGTDKELLAKIHEQAIRLADIVYCLTKFNGEMGDSVIREMQYANSLGKAILVGHPAKGNWIPGSEYME